MPIIAIDSFASIKHQNNKKPRLPLISDFFFYFFEKKYLGEATGYLRRARDKKAPIRARVRFQFICSRWYGQRPNNRLFLPKRIEWVGLRRYLIRECRPQVSYYSRVEPGFIARDLCDRSWRNCMAGLDTFCFWYCNIFRILNLLFWSLSRNIVVYRSEFQTSQGLRFIFRMKKLIFFYFNWIFEHIFESFKFDKCFFRLKN